MSVTVQKTFLSTHVTCVKFIGSYILAGVGGNLNVIEIKTRGHDTELKKVVEIYENQNIYGIKPRSESELLIYGGRNVTVLKFDIPSLRFEVSKRIIIDDWILDCIWLDSTNAAALTMNNAVSKIDLNSGKIEKVSCEMRCILYSGVVLKDKWSNLVILAGTVFQEVIIWSLTNKSPIHTLKGHKGVIFSVKYDTLTERICTTSDDRTVRIWSVKFSDEMKNWSKCDIILQHTIFAHMARVWDCHFLSNSWIVSIGEDSLISIWNGDAKCENQWYGHQGGSIWSIDCCEKLKIVATGGSDGGIDLWPLASKSKLLFLPFNISDQRTPKSLVINRFGKLILSTNLGELWTYTENRWILSYFNEIFKNYLLLSISPDRIYISLASINGHIYLFKADDVEICLEMKAVDGRIFSLSWLDSSLLVTSGIGGRISLWKFDSGRNDLEALETFILPECKERWITCSCVSGEFFLCGDRNGSIHLFHRSKNNQNPISTLKREHGPRGVSDLKNINSDLFISTGRDGTYKQIRIENEKLAVSSTYKLPMEWPAAFRQTESFGNVILGFYEIRFIVWSLDERRILLSIECGGGHRSWDCHFDQNINVAYIKEKSISYFSEILANISLGTALTGSHSKTINSCCLLNLENSHFLVSGSEDTTLKLFDVSDGFLKSKGTYRRHISSVKSLCSFISKDDLYVASGGGRGQLILWRLSTKNPSLIELSENILRVENKPSEQEPLDEPEIRYMDLSILEDNNKINIFAGCSDGIVRCHSFDPSNGKMNLGICVKNDFCCILKLSSINNVLSCSYTNGNVSLWKIDDLVHNKQDAVCLKVHSLGINGCDLVEFEGSYVLATGSDDSSIALNVLDGNLNILSTYNHKNLHNCQISGIKLIGNFLITGGMDQKICVLSWSFSDSVLKAILISEVKTCVPDVHGILIKSEEDVITVYLYGIGVQIVNLAIS